MRLYIACISLLLCIDVCLSDSGFRNPAGQNNLETPGNLNLRIATNEYLLPSNSELINDHKQSFVRGGERATRGQFPYQVSVRQRKGRGLTTCGGSLISLNYVITAAHCVQNDTEDGTWLVYVGSNDLNATNEFGRVIYTVTRPNIKIHELYDPEEVRNDVALIRLPQPVIVSLFVRPIHLPTRAESAHPLSFVGEVGTMSGWGLTNNTPASLQRELRFARVPVIDQTVCTTDEAYPIDNNQICASGTLASMCGGDSGGPLVVPVREDITFLSIVLGTRFVPKLIGALSGKVGACEDPTPSVFARIGAYLDWIGANSDVVIR